MEPTEISAFYGASMASFLGLEDVFLQHRAGTLDPSAWATMTVGLRILFATPGFRVAWKRQRASLNGGFPEFGDKLLTDTRVHLPVDIAARWKADVTTELAPIQR